MAGFIHGIARYPGVLSLQDATYTTSHGRSPGVAILRINPQPFPPDPEGDLLFSDGNETVPIPDCKLLSIKVERDDKGFFWTLEILDRRWRWNNLGYINGCYNQMDPFGKLIPWTIRSPTELAVLCLTAMGETDYEINLPPGLNYPGPFFGQPIPNISGVNPPVNWDGVPPAQALQEVCDRCGCRIVYQLSTNSILIAPIGVGNDLPPGSIRKRGPTLTTPQAPSGVGVIGSPTRYQMRLMLTAVGKEWDGSYRPINLLSYAPRDAKGNVTWANSWPPLFPNVQKTKRLTQTDAQRLAQESVFRTYQLTGVDVSGKGAPNVPGYGPVQRTQQIVLQSTQVDQVQPGDQDRSIALSNPTVLPPDAPGAQGVFPPLTVNFYNGYSRDKPAAVYGQIAQEIVLNNIWYPGAVGLNTPKGSQVHVPFETIPEFFMIRFSTPVFERKADGTVQIPLLTLQTAVMVRDVANNQLTAFTNIQPLDGGDPIAPPLMRHYPDIQANVTSTYDNNNKLQNWSLLEADPLLRAGYYLTAMANEFQIKGGQIVEYNGIRAIDLDGLTQQITWSVGGEGCSTVVSQNCEHSIWVPPYPARRRAEFLPVPDALQGGGRINMAEPERGRVLRPAVNFGAL